MLYPQQNRNRVVCDVSGFWRFRPDPDDQGKDERWYEESWPHAETLTIAVPGAWNEQLTEQGLMNYIGAAWYATELTLAEHVSRGQRIWLYIGAADHRADVWLNGTWLGMHEGGFLPFEIELTDAWHADAPNHVVIRVDSTLRMDTLPQVVHPNADPYNDASYRRRHLFPATRFDFFPYGGLTRAVYLCTTPAARLETITVDAQLDGHVRLHVESSGGAQVSVTIADSQGTVVATREDLTLESTGVDVAMRVQDVRPWSPASPHLYTATITLYDADGHLLDTYAERFGIREIRIEGGQLLLNDEPLYLTGFGKHEDFPVVGRGAFRAAYLRDFELLRWSGANSFRTSHYPYDEELIRLADELGFLVIDEVPAVSLGFDSAAFEDLGPLLANHKKALTELMARDRNHPSVIAWSTVNEANLWSETHYNNGASRQYFQEVYAHTRSLDASRPVIAITFAGHSVDDVALEACDVIGLNRYFGWYSDPTDLDKAAQDLSQELEAHYARYGKPIILTEFGADTMEGLHATTAQLFTEEFQAAFIQTYCDVVDSKPFCAGTHVWNFADFRTPQHFRRVVLNRKGVFNRNREPKRAAFILREHWTDHPRVAERHRPAQAQPGVLIRDRKHPIPTAPDDALPDTIPGNGYAQTRS